MSLKAIAKELGLSITTVSRALNGYPEVSEKTRQKVLAAAQRFGYRPSPAARRLATGRAHALGVVFNAERNLLMDPLFVEYLAGVAETSAKQGFDILISPSTPRDEIATFGRLAQDGTVDVVILSAPLIVDPRIALLSELKFPFVVHGRPPSPAGISYLDIDNFGAFQQATSFLIQLGHRRIGLINGQSHLTFAIRRKKGMVRALDANGLSFDEALSHNSPMTDEYGYRAMERFLAHAEPPTAVLCSSTVMALGAVRAINRAKLTIGKDISIIAHDDVLPMLKPENFMVPLTTTRSSLRAAGQRIARRLIAGILQLETLPQQELWKTDLIVRASTGPAPGK